jgi:hypothetical protein
VPSFRAGSATAEATAANATYTAPAGLADGDWIYITHLEYSGSTSQPPTPTPPAGFTAPTGTWPIDQTDASGFHENIWLWRKKASGESGNYVVTHASCVRRGTIFAASGADGTTPEQGVTQNHGTGTTTTFLGITTTADSCLIVVSGEDNNDKGLNLTAPTGTTPTFTEQVDDNHGEYLASGILSPAGATGNKTMTNNSNVAAPWLAVMLAIQPPAGIVTAPRRMPLSM